MANILFLVGGCVSCFCLLFSKILCFHVACDSPIIPLAQGPPSVLDFDRASPLGRLFCVRCSSNIHLCMVLKLLGMMRSHYELQSTSIRPIFYGQSGWL